MINGRQPLPFSRAKYIGQEGGTRIDAAACWKLFVSRQNGTIHQAHPELLPFHFMPYLFPLTSSRSTNHSSCLLWQLLIIESHLDSHEDRANLNCLTVE